MSLHRPALDPGSHWYDAFPPTLNPSPQRGRETSSALSAAYNCNQEIICPRHPRAGHEGPLWDCKCRSSEDQTPPPFGLPGRRSGVHTTQADPGSRLDGAVWEALVTRRTLPSLCLQTDPSSRPGMPRGDALCLRSGHPQDHLHHQRNRKSEPRDPEIN